MTNETKSYLVKEVVQETNVDSKAVETIIDYLCKNGAINLFWSPENRQIKQTNKLEIPKKFHMVSPLFKGIVNYIEREGWVGYADENGNVRIQAPNTKALAKKIVKYAK